MFSIPSRAKSGVRARLIPALALLVGGACADPGTAARSVERDSAGVHIVENAVDGPVPALGWTIGPDPDVDIGGAEANPEQQLFRVVGTLQLVNGRIVIANAGSGELRFYDGDGHFARSFSVQTSAELPFANVIGLFDDMTLLGQGFVQAGDAPPSGPQRYPNTLYHLDTLAALATSLGDARGSERYFESMEDGRMFWVSPALFGRSTSYLAAGSHYYIAANDTYQIEAYQPDGTLAWVLRLARPAAPVTDALVDLERRRRLENAEDDNERRLQERVFAKLPRPPTLPAYSRVVIDASRHFWIADYDPARDVGAEWTVFDPSGHLLGRLHLPEGFLPRHIGRDFLLGTYTDDLDVEHVRRYALDRMSASE